MRDVILGTGGAGFIGSNFILYWNETLGSPVVNLDLLTYAGNPAGLSPRNKLIAIVKDRLGHDRRYALDNTKISAEIGWKPALRFKDSLRPAAESLVPGPYGDCCVI